MLSVNALQGSNRLSRQATIDETAVIVAVNEEAEKQVITNVLTLLTFYSDKYLTPSAIILCLAGCGEIGERERVPKYTSNSCR